MPPSISDPVFFVERFFDYDTTGSVRWKDFVRMYREFESDCGLERIHSIKDHFFPILGDVGIDLVEGLLHGIVMR